MRSQNNFYKILGIDRRASGDEIKNAYRRLANRFHPDVSDDSDGERKFKVVAEAYKTLKCPETRAQPTTGSPHCSYADKRSRGIWCPVIHHL